MTGKILHILFLSIVLIAVSACANQSYHHESTHSYPIRERAVIQSEGDISISISVTQTRMKQRQFLAYPFISAAYSLSGWKCVNNSPERIRFAPTGLDPKILSPLEVSYMHRKGLQQRSTGANGSAFSRQRNAAADTSRRDPLRLCFYPCTSPGTKSFHYRPVQCPAQITASRFFVTVPGFCSRPCRD